MRVKSKAHTMRILKENVTYTTFVIPAVILILLFGYLPIFGVVLAFKDYKVTGGIWGSEWAEPLFRNFKFFFESNNAWRVTRNTLLLNFLFITVNTSAAVLFALLLYEVKKAIHVKVYQTFAMIPRFLSWVAVSYIVYGLLDYEKGIVNRIITSLGGEGISWYTSPGYWPVILSIVSCWHVVGQKCIVYYASLMGINNELFEAAEMDGANKFQRIIHISVPHLLPVVIMLAILDVGSIFRADFGLFYNVTRNVGALYPTTDVMDTFVYRALMDSTNIGMSSAATLIQSIVCTATILLTNAIVKKISPEHTLF